MDHYQVSLPPSTTTGLLFKVHRKQPELVTPAKPTPRELKPLSDIDDQQGLRFQIPVIFFYRPNLTSNHDPVQVIKKALAETLVYYYPFAGRLREGPNRKLAVDCTGEGVLFIEADADVAFAELEEADALLPPFPCLEELLFDVAGSNELLNTPLLLVQVTRLKCGGFIFALRFNHTMTDGAGVSLFLKSLCELACGLHTPSVPPVWDRHLLTASASASVTHTHREYEKKDEIDTIPIGVPLVSRSFFFGAGEFSAIRRLLPSGLHNTTFEALTSFLWRCRTVALSPNPNTEMRMTCIINSRGKLSNPPLPQGYYGNVFVIPVAIASAGDLMEKPLEFALRLIQETKASVTEDYVRSVTALMTTRGRPMFVTAGNYIVSDLRHFDFGKVDFGPWGKPVYGGTAKAGIAVFPGVSFYVPFKNKMGETGTVVAISLPDHYKKRPLPDPKYQPEDDNNPRRNITVIVSGYDKSLPVDTITTLLREHFSSCGEITRVYIHAHADSKIHNKYAFVDIIGVGAKEKALHLSGSDVGGHKLLVKFKPVSTKYFSEFTHEEAFDWSELNEISRNNPRPTVVMVSGYDTRLPEESVSSALSKHFSSCGEVDLVIIGLNKDGDLRDTVGMEIWGEGVAEKARELSGSDMGGWKVVVGHCSGPRDVRLNEIHRGRSHVPKRGRGGRLY
ncbi:hypothetical protein AALP_AA3G064500 [Arabis alpina]|uniref:RRM domain-containing protein n=1 Tax=Arabis alpina TaxID=50452 RepID=A0A087H7F5_ARAAL|nr:hypothetical protein AALP_AA3G064500 [Arabis alpina]